MEIDSRTTRPVDNSARGQLGPWTARPVADNSARKKRTTRPVAESSACTFLYIYKILFALFVVLFVYVRWNFFVLNK